MTLEPFVIGPQDDVGGRVVGVGMHRVRAVEEPRSRKAHVAGLQRDDADWKVYSQKSDLSVVMGRWLASSGQTAR
jgi:hypothetical protein